ncbi:MAG: biotin/lipoyl-containing protein, partial [Pseudomonadota bacterium]
MATEIVVPALGESVTEGTIAKWLKKVGDSVAVDEPLVELETDKVTLEVNATVAGALANISADEGATVEVGAVLGLIEDGAAVTASSAAPAAAAAPDAGGAPTASSTSEIDIVVPALGESVTEGTISKWLKHVGDAVAVDEPLVELETDKVTLEVNATAAGALGSIAAEAGATVEVGAVIGKISGGTAGAAPAAPAAAAPQPAAASSPAASAGDSDEQSPAVRKLIAENNLDPAKIKGTGKDGRLTKGDVLAAIESGSAKTAAPASEACSNSRSRIRALLSGSRLPVASSDRIRFGCVTNAR